MKTIIITRATSSSGKTTFANFLKGLYPQAVICCADDYHTDANGDYNWCAENQGKAHQYSRDVCLGAIKNGCELIIIANTNCTERDMQPYQEMAEQYGYRVFYTVLERRHDGKNNHDLPEGVFVRQETNLRNSLKFR